MSQRGPNVRDLAGIPIPIVSADRPTETGSFHTDSDEFNEILGFYTVVLGPGVIRYMRLRTVFGADAEDVITELSKLGDRLRVQDPESAFVRGERLPFEEVQQILSSDLWQDRVRVHGALLRHLVTEQMPWEVYFQFHISLQLGNRLALSDCQDSWVRGTERNVDLVQTFSGLAEYHVIAGPRFCCVYRKTDFVANRLHLIAQEAKRLDDLVNEQKATIELNALQKSRFQTFLYIMEDLRNGAIKIGQSKTPSERERTLQSEVPEVKLRLSIPADQAHERHLHLHFGVKRLRGEWFSLDAEDVLWLVSYLKKNGDASRATADYEWLGRLLLQSKQ